MEFHDWSQWFSHVSFCRIVNTSVMSLKKTWHEKEFHGKWEGRSAGGCSNHQDTFLHNPQVNRLMIVIVVIVVIIVVVVVYISLPLVYLKIKR